MAGTCQVCGEIREVCEYEPWYRAICPACYSNLVYSRVLEERASQAPNDGDYDVLPDGTIVY